MWGNVLSTSPSASGRPEPPPPVPPWQLAQLEYASAPIPSGGSATSGGRVSARTYMSAQIGIRLSAASGQNGSLARAFAAAMYGGSGFGGGGAGGAAGG